MPATTTSTVTMSNPSCSAKTAGRVGAKLRRRTRRHMAVMLRPAPGDGAGESGGCENDAMQEAFGVVLFGVVFLAAVVAVITFASSRRAFDQIGADGLNDGSDRPGSEPLSGAGFAAIRDEEARQMLEARNARRIRQGKEPLDVERELARLLAAPAPSAADAQLTGEIRDLVLARNRRRVKQGKEPLDVEAEVARQLAELG